MQQKSQNTYESEKIPNSKGQTLGFKKFVERTQNTSQKLPDNPKSARYLPEQVCKLAPGDTFLKLVRQFSSMGRQYLHGSATLSCHATLYPIDMRHLFYSSATLSLWPCYTFGATLFLKLCNTFSKAVY